MRFLSCLLAIALSLLRSAAAEDFLPGAKRILFLGDSITYSGQYVDRFEAFLFTQFPQREFVVIDCGLPSETVSGLSEEGHADGKFPRPDLHERLDRVLAKTKPGVIFACYGMNDGIYLPFAEERFRKFKDGMEKLRAKAAAAGAKVIHLTPPVFDAAPIKNRVAPAGKADAAHPFEGYDDVLVRYSAWLIEQRAQGWQVIDVHGAMSAALAARRALAPEFTFAKDGVHPDAGGHAVIAQAVIDALAPEQAEAFEEFLASEWAASSKSLAFFQSIAKRRKLLADAWLTATGHKRPGMATGLPLAEAEEQAAALERTIRAAAKSAR
jgi:lysophospholipase L1-like esterase